MFAKAKHLGIIGGVIFGITLALMYGMDVLAASIEANSEGVTFTGYSMPGWFSLILAILGITFMLGLVIIVVAVASFVFNLWVYSKTGLPEKKQVGRVETAGSPADFIDSPYLAIEG